MKRWELSTPQLFRPDRCVCMEFAPVPHEARFAVAFAPGWRFRERMASTSDLHPRAAELISLLNLEPHPEGGYFRQVYRSVAQVDPVDERSSRAALTTIYFLLQGGDRSCWHQVTSDEVWHFYEGDSLELFCATEDFSQVERHLLGPVAGESCPVHVIPPHHWQAARSTGAYTLVGCTVGPGFEFSDFRMLNQLPSQAEALRNRRPEWAELI